MEVERIFTFLKNRVVVTLFLMLFIIVTLVIIWFTASRILEQWHRRRYGVLDGVFLGDVNISRLYIIEVEELLLKELPQLVRWPVSAHIDQNGVITREEWGRMLDLAATLELVKSAEKNEKIEPVFVPIYPSLVAQEILALTHLLGTYNTLVSGSDERYHNIKLAGSYINFTLLMPGEVFSFNKIVGEPSAARGFKEAPVIVEDEFVPGYGGGICQVSSTLYNAVLKAGLKVIERYSHSQEVNYVPPGKDATVAYDYLDFKFANSLTHPILVRVWVWGRRLQVGLYGPEN